MISPSDTFTVYLDMDKPESEREPEAKRPALVYRFGTANELREHERKMEDLNHLHGLAYNDAVMERATFNLVSHRNLLRDDGSEADDLGDVMTIGDLKALAYRITLMAELSEADRKKSESPQRSPVAESADPAGSEENAETRRQS